MDQRAPMRSALQHDGEASSVALAHSAAPLVCFVPEADMPDDAATPIRISMDDTLARRQH
jgi:hypothetical protein